MDKSKNKTNNNGNAIITLDASTMATREQVALAVNGLASIIDAPHTYEKVETIAAGETIVTYKVSAPRGGDVIESVEVVDPLDVEILRGADILRSVGSAATIAACGRFMAMRDSKVYERLGYKSFSAFAELWTAVSPLTARQYARIAESFLNVSIPSGEVNGYKADWLRGVSLSNLLELLPLVDDMSLDDIRAFLLTNKISLALPAKKLRDSIKTARKGENKDEKNGEKTNETKEEKNGGKSANDIGTIDGMASALVESKASPIDKAFAISMSLPQVYKALGDEAWKAIAPHVDAILEAIEVIKTASAVIS